MHTQLTVQESRHRLARKIFHGQRGDLRQRYREGGRKATLCTTPTSTACPRWATRT